MTQAPFLEGIYSQGRDFSRLVQTVGLNGTLLCTE